MKNSHSIMYLLIALIFGDGWGMGGNSHSIMYLLIIALALVDALDKRIHIP